MSERAGVLSRVSTVALLIWFIIRLFQFIFFNQNTIFFS
jgi:hypothetical protein